MHCFVDSQGRSWTIRVDVNSIRRVREATGVDFGKVLIDKTIMSDLSQDACKLVDVIYILVRPQCESQNVDAESFGAAMVGDPIDAACEALLDAIMDFFPSSRRMPLKAAVEASKRGQKLAMEKLDEAISKGLMDRQINKDIKAMEERLAKALSS